MSLNCVLDLRESVLTPTHTDLLGLGHDGTRFLVARLETLEGQLAELVTQQLSALVNELLLEQILSRGTLLVSLPQQCF